MQGLTGMDIAQVRALARSLAAEADDIWAEVMRLTARLRDVNWVGPDRDRFVGEWEGHVAGLRRGADGLHDASERARRYADMQEWASRTP